GARLCPRVAPAVPVPVVLRPTTGALFRASLRVVILTRVAAPRITVRYAGPLLGHGPLAVAGGRIAPFELKIRRVGRRPAVPGRLTSERCTRSHADNDRGREGREREQREQRLLAHVCAPLSPVIGQRQIGASGKATPAKTCSSNGSA